MPKQLFLKPTNQAKPSSLLQNHEEPGEGGTPSHTPSTPSLSCRCSSAGPAPPASRTGTASPDLPECGTQLPARASRGASSTCRSQHHCCHHPWLSTHAAPPLPTRTAFRCRFPVEASEERSQSSIKRLGSSGAPSGARTGTRTPSPTPTENGHVRWPAAACPEKRRPRPAAAVARAPSSNP